MRVPNLRELRGVARSTEARDATGDPRGATKGRADSCSNNQAKAVGRACWKPVGSARPPRAGYGVTPTASSSVGAMASFAAGRTIGRSVRGGQASDRQGAWNEAGLG